MEKRENNFYSGMTGYSGWKYYNLIKKKAINQINEELTISSLLVSLIIAFFICTSCATALSLINTYFEKKGDTEQIIRSIFYSKEDKGIQNAKSYTEKEIKRIIMQSTIAVDNFKKKSLVETAQAAGLDFQAEPEKFTHYINIKSGEELKYQLKIKNTGSQTWKSADTYLETGPYLRSFSKFKHSNWLNYYCPTALKKDVGPNQTATFDIFLMAPEGISGDIQENFQIVINGRSVSGSLTRIFLNLNEKSSTTNSASQNIAANNNSNTSSSLINTTATAVQTVKKADFCIALTDSEKKNYSECNTAAIENDNTNGETQNNTNLLNAPIMRVGLYSTKNTQRVTMNKLFDVYSGKELLVSGVKAGEVVTIGFDFKNKRYSLNYNTINYSRTSPIRFVSREQRAVATLMDFDSRPAWNTYYNDNMFRNIIEFQYSKDTGKLWIINELPIYDYLKGMAETSNYSPLEFQKVLITAARTYAMYHYNRGIEYKVVDGSTKHASEHFHVDATYDQVYRGYNSELRMPKLSQAVDETYGMVITYNDKVVITPYFSRSDGRTRSWQEVWQGEAKPWLKSVPVPQDKGQTLWGHGVGMSARGALIMARDEGKSWQNILKHFYQGISLKKIY